MARKPRDYKAEYAAAKRRATASGYKSEREYKQVRKALKLPRTAQPAPRRILEKTAPRKLARATNAPKVASQRRREAREWSDKHSHRPHSRYSPKMSDRQVALYHKAFVEPLPPELYYSDQREWERRKLARIKDYLVPDLLPTEDDWNVNPSTVPLRR